MSARPATRSLCANVLRSGGRSAASKRPLSTFTRQTQHQTCRSLARPCQHCQVQRVQLQQQRNATSFSRGFAGDAKALWRKHPFSVTLATFFILFGAGTLIYVNYIYQTYIIGAFHKFPEPVAQKLRRALWYTNNDLQPKEAVKYYKQALEVADEIGMDPFSDEILGVKIQVAALMEKIQNYPKAIEVLERVRADCLQWDVKMGGLERKRAQRINVLKKAIAISIRLGELYSNQYIRDGASAEEHLVWAVETILKEKIRRNKEGVREDEGDWVTDDEFGASMEALAHNYEETDRHYLATPLFLQALSVKPVQDCHSVVLMNNLSIALAQQKPPPTPGQAPISREALVSNAREWAQKALDVAAGIAPPLRDEECDLGCAVAMHNLGEFAEMSNDLAEARKRYREASSLARAIGFDEGAKNSQDALNRIAKADG